MADEVEADMALGACVSCWRRRAGMMTAVGAVHPPHFYSPGDGHAVRFPLLRCEQSNRQLTMPRAMMQRTWTSTRTTMTRATWCWT